MLRFLGSYSDARVQHTTQLTEALQNILTQRASAVIAVDAHQAGTVYTLCPSSSLQVSQKRLNIATVRAAALY